LFLLSDFAAALKRYEQSAQLAEKNRDRLAQGRALSQMGRVTCYLGSKDRARKYLDQALALLRVDRDTTAISRSAYGEALTNLAEVIHARGNLIKALDQVTEATSFFDGDRKGQARAARLTGFTTGTLGNIPKAKPAILRALDLARAIDDKVEEGLALTLLGTLYAFTGEPVQGLECHESARQILRSIGDRHSEAIAVNGFGQVHQVQHDLPSAIMKYEEALSLFESTGALDSVAVQTFKLASLYVTENKERALEYFERSVTLGRTVGNLRNEANALSEIAMVYASQDRPDLAAKQHRRVLGFFKAVGDYRGQATALNNYGDFLFNKLGEKQQALDAYLEALPLSEKVRDQWLLSTTLYNVARAQQSLGKYEVALSYVDRSINMIEALRTNVGGPDLRALYFSGVRQHYDLSRDILMQMDRVRPGEGFDARALLISEKSRARSLIELASASQAGLREGASAELLSYERQVGTSIASLAQHEWDLSVDEKADSAELAEVRRRLSELRAEYQQIQAKLWEQNPRQSLLLDFEFKDVQQMQQVFRGTDAMLLEYGLGEDRSYLWAVTATSFHTYILPGRKVLEDATREVYELITARQKFADGDAAEYRAKVEAAEKQYPEKARALGEVLLGPIAQQLGNRQLIFVTEGALQFAPFEALPVPGSQTASQQEKHLLETNQVAAVPSMSMLMTMRANHSRPTPRGRLVAIIADPVFSRSDDRVQSPGLSRSIAHAASSSGSEQTRGSDFLRGAAARLSYSSEEADAISAIAPWGTIMVARGLMPAAKPQ
jgi:tetratricopeptide (TPR) repeat protein